MRCLKIAGYAMFVVFSLLLSSCTNEFELAPLELEMLKEHFPFTEYVNADKIVFKNATDNELVFNVEHVSPSGVSFDKGLPYEGEYENFILTQNNISYVSDDPCIEPISFGIFLSASYINGDPIKQIKIYQNRDHSARFLLTLDSLGMTSNVPVARMSILTESYEEVATSTNVKTDEVEPGFYYTKKSGLVGFYDENDELWLFDRFE